MKKTLLLLLIPFFGYSQSNVDSLTLPYKDGKVVFERVIDAPNTTKDVLFISAKRWIADSFKDSKSVIQTEDKDAGEILGSGNVTVVSGQDAIFIYMKNFKFRFMVNLKDNKYRIRFYDLIWDYGTPQYPFLKNIEEIDKLTINTANLNKRQTERKNREIAAINANFYGLIENFKVSLTTAKSDDF